MAIDPISIGITLALTAAQMALTASQTIEGQRLDNLKVSTGDYGYPLVRAWGQVRIDTSPIWAEDIREVKRRRKTKGGKYNEYTYYGTWASVIAGHEITKVEKIRFDTYLVYDNTGAGPLSPFTLSEEDPVSITDLMTIYLGTPDQAIDPRMQATIEAEFGVGYCPAYRNTALVVFKDMPLEKIGNRIPQVACEIIGTAGGDEFQVDVYEEVVDTATQDYYSAPLSNEVWFTSPNGRYGISADTNDTWFLFDFQLGQVVWYSNPVDLELANPLLFDFILKGVDDDGTVWVVALFDIDPYYFWLCSIEPEAPNTLNMEASFEDDWDVYYVTPFTVPTLGTVIAIGKIAFALMEDFDYFVKGDTLYSLSVSGWEPKRFFQDSVGDLWTYGVVQVVTGMSLTIDTLHFHRFTDITGTSIYPANQTFTGLPVWDDTHAVLPIQGGYFYFGTFIGVWRPSPSGGPNDTTLIRLDLDGSETILEATAPGGETAERIWPGWEYPLPIAPNSEQFFLTRYPPFEFPLRTWLSVNASDFSIDILYDLDMWGVDEDLSGNWYVGGDTNALLGSTSVWADDINTGTLYVMHLGAEELTLGRIASDVADWVGIIDYDFSDQTQVVQGWYVTHGPAQNMIEPLFTLYDVTIRLNGFTIEGVNRGQNPTTVIDVTADAVLSNPLYRLRQKQPHDLPQALITAFSDINIDKQPNLARTPRGYLTGPVGEERTISMSPWTSDPDEAQQLNNRMFRRKWNQNLHLTALFPNHYYPVLAADHYALLVDGETWAAMSMRVVYNFEQDNITIEWEEDFAGLNALDGSTGAVFMGSEPSVIRVPISTKGFLLDTPLLQDVDNDVNPLVYLLTGPGLDTDDDGFWPGATMFSLFDGEYTVEEYTFVSSERTVWGTALTELAPADPAWWDRGNTVDILLEHGTLESTTEELCDADFTHNLVWFAGELMQYTVAELIAENTFRVSGFRRAMRGTEQYLDTHVIGDVFVVLEHRAREERGISEVGTDLSMKPVTVGTLSLSDGVEVLEPYTGASLKPYAVINVVAVWEADDDIYVAWERRSRTGAAWTSGTTVPLSEATEEYEIDVMDGVDVANTYVVTDPEWTYTAADQVTDFGVEQTTVTLRIYQMSDAVGRGFVREVTLTA